MAHPNRNGTIKEPSTRDTREPDGFLAFWSTWPSGGRKQARGKCLDAWKKTGAERDAQLIVMHIEHLKAGDEWKRDNGRFIVAPLVYLNQRRWEGVELPDTYSSIGSYV